MICQRLMNGCENKGLDDVSCLQMLLWLALSAVGGLAVCWQGSEDDGEDDDWQLIENTAL